MNDRFGFGANWQGYLDAHFSEERAEIARKWLLEFMKLDTLQGLTFLDIGSGSGIHSLGAWRSHATKVVSFDYDPLSVEATHRLQQSAGAPSNWTISQGSILDKALCEQLGSADIVYSWGVLHHTGDQWTAISNAISLMGPKSRLYIALYTSDQYIDPPPEYWLDVKRRYNSANALTKRLMEAAYVWRQVCHRKLSNVLRLPSIAKAYQADRGMALMPDVRDWLGGWPMEFSSVREVIEFAEQRGLSLVNIKTGAGNTEYLFVPADAVAELGYTLVPRKEIAIYFLGLIRTLADLKARGEFFIFGTASGAKLLKQSLEKIGPGQIAGFIDLEQSGELDGVPVYSLDDFAARFPKDTTIVLSNKYIAENSERLAGLGFTNVHNALPLIWILAAQ